MKQKIVVKVYMRCGKCRKEAMKIAATANGVISVAVQGNDKDQIVVVGNEVDAAELCAALRKKVGNGILLSVEEVKDPKPEEKKKEGEKTEEKKTEEKKEGGDQKKKEEDQDKKKKEENKEEAKKTESTPSQLPACVYPPYPPPNYCYPNHQPHLQLMYTIPPDDHYNNQGCSVM